MAGLGDTTRLIDDVDYNVNIYAPNSVRSTPMEHALAARGLECRVHANSWREQRHTSGVNTVIPVICRTPMTVLAAKQAVNFAMEQGSGFHVAENNIEIYGSDYREPSVLERLESGGENLGTALGEGIGSAIIVAAIYGVIGLGVLYLVFRD